MTILIFFILGAIGWSFTEYALHRWNGHGMKGKTRFSREHLRHHAVEGYFAPLWAKIGVAGLVGSIVGALGIGILGPEAGLAFTFGFMVSYGSYEALHSRLHSHGPSTAFGRWARKHHFAHHFNCPKLNHGVTSPIWDIVFRSRRQVTQVRVPRKKSMSWLTDNEGELLPQYAQDYVLAGRRHGPLI